ncbi:MAG: nucleotide exchange factor GrpE [Balneolaceae bacterium]
MNKKKRFKKHNMNNKNQDIESPDVQTDEETKNITQSEEVSDDNELILEQQKRIDELEYELNEAKEAGLRRAAEMENFRKRLQREKQQIFEQARITALEDFLPINDDLIRTLQAIENSDADKSVVEGIQLIANKFNDVLEKKGVQRIDETGVPFDVDVHDALFRQKPEDDSIESNIVLQVVENGYKINDRTIRHAKVIVSE